MQTEKIIVFQNAPERKNRSAETANTAAKTAPAQKEMIERELKEYITEIKTALEKTGQGEETLYTMFSYVLTYMFTLIKETTPTTVERNVERGKFKQ